VIRGSARAKYGDAMLSQINAGAYEPSPAFAALAETPFAAAPAAQLALATAPAASGSGAATLAAALGGQPAPAITNRYFLDWAAARNDLLTSGDLRDTIKDITREFFRMNA
jgi:hypothetical protein